MNSPQTYFPFAARLLMSIIFLLSGFNKITGWDASMGYMTSKGMPMPAFFLAAAIVVELAGGLSLLLGAKARYGAGLLFLYLIPVTLIFHNFWALTGMEQQMQMVNFLKNLAIMGGLLEVAAFGAGALSFDARTGETSLPMDFHGGLHTPA